MRGLTLTQLAAALELKPGAAAAILVDFRRRGVAEEEAGRWRLTERGWDLASGLRPDDEEATSGRR
jgi:DNA-binding IclR family transcriptional regulator